VPTGPRQFRHELLQVPTPDREFADRYTAMVDAWVGQLVAAAFASSGVAPDAPVAVLAVGGYGRGELCPASDLDLIVVHDRVRDVAAFADALWYPIWDSGIHLDHSVRTPKQVTEMVGSDVRVALGLLTARPVAGHVALAGRVVEETRKHWGAKPRVSLGRLRAAVEERWARYGDLAHLVEPDLKEAQGGLRDVEAMAAAGLIAPVARGTIDEPRLADAHATLLAARVALHLATGRATDVLTVEHQDAVAARLGHPDRLAFMTDVAAAGARVAWAAEDAWRRIDSWSTGPVRRSGRDRPVAPGVVLRDGEVALDGSVAAGSDPSLALRLAAAAARRGVPMAHAALASLEHDAVVPAGPWPEAVRDALVALLGSGPPAVQAVLTLDHIGVWERYVPEWAAVRSRPQASSYHRFTVDRHLMEAAAAAAAFVRRVHRPDLLLVAALLHDIGKIGADDHTAVGMDMAATIGARMGFADADVAVLVQLVRDHLLLADAATRRDVRDPATAATVAERVGTSDQLDLLAALTEADALATGATAWSPWKASLVAELVNRTTSVLAGHAWEPPPELPAEHRRVMAEGRLRLLGATDRVTVIAPDRHGLLAAVAGTLSLHRLPVRSATATSEGGMVADEFQLDLSLVGSVTEWARIEADLARALEDPDWLDGQLARRARPHPTKPGAAEPSAPVVLFDSRASERATVMEVRAPDGKGVLYRVARAIAAAGVEVISAKVLTLGDEVVDTFYVCDTATADKLHDPAELARLELAVLTELARPW
jgi:[protein-PII] uridylyltransferase